MKYKVYSSERSGSTSIIDIVVNIGVIPYARNEFEDLAADTEVGEKI